MPKEDLEYRIRLTKKQKEFKIINLYCNSIFIVVTS